MKSLSFITTPYVIARGKAPKQSPVIAKPVGLKQSPRRCAPRDDASINVFASEAKQSGFGLLELMLATMIAAGITLGYLYNQSRQSAINQAQSQAGYYQMVSDAVFKYMANNNVQLKAITKPKTCADLALFTDATAATAATAPTGCGIQALFMSGSASSPVANGLQPTLNDLKNTGYLDANFSNSFMWPTQLTMYAAFGLASGSSYAAPEYRVQIQAWCNGAAPTTDTVCANPVLRSLVYNAQPFAASTNDGLINFSRMDKLMQARTALGANAFIAYDWSLKKDAYLYSDGDKNKLPNMLKFSSGSDAGTGLEGVLALQATYMPAQETSPPTPTPSPTPTPTPMTGDLKGAIPYTWCNPLKDTYAYASKEQSRVTPIGKLNKTTGLCEPAMYNASMNSNPVMLIAPFYAYIVPSGQALACKPNRKAVNYLNSDYECPIPDGWTTCTTWWRTYRGPAGTTAFAEPQFKYITIEPLDGGADNCWQPSPDVVRIATKKPGFWSNDGGMLAPTWDEYLTVMNYAAFDQFNLSNRRGWEMWKSPDKCIAPACVKLPMHGTGDGGYQNFNINSSQP